MKRAEVEKVLATMSVVRQCGLLELSRSTFYYQPVGEDAYNLALMRRIDEQFTKRPFYGVPRMTASLRMMGYGVNPKRVRRLMRVMELEAIYPKPRLSANGPDHKVYPYLFRRTALAAGQVRGSLSSRLPGGPGGEDTSFRLFRVF